MDFDIAKENIQPLACGRNVRYLEAALNADSHSHHEELVRQRKEFEDAIRTYDGDDPLQSWYDYIAWIEQSYPSGGKESGLEEVLLKCLEIFENDQRYLQDRRMIKLYIKYIDTQLNPTEYYQELYNLGIGTMIADFYICWAYHYDICGNFQKAESVFRKGLDARAQPFDALDEAHKHFGFTMSQRILHKDEEKYEKEFLETMKERRYALTSLKSHRKKVGSVRTGVAVKSHTPGKIQIDSNSQHARGNNAGSNITLQVFEDQNENRNAATAVFSGNAATIIDDTNSGDVSRSQSLIRSIIDSSRKQENLIEPGPWSKAKERSQKRIDFATASSSSRNHSLPFEILEDDEAAESGSDNKEPLIPLPDEFNYYVKGIQLSNNFVAHNKPQKEWKVPVTLETNITGRALPQYEKFYLYPKENQEFSLDEFCGYKWFKKNNISNTLTNRLDPIWMNVYDSGIRLFPQFKPKNDPQSEFFVERFIQDESISNNCKFAIKINEIYPSNSKNEFQFEEIVATKWKKGERKLKFCPDETIMIEEDMEETHCAWGGFDTQSRRSFFPSRKSLLYSGNGGSRKSMASLRKSMAAPLPSSIEEPNKKEDKEQSVRISKEFPVTSTVPVGTIQDTQNSSNNLLRRNIIIEDPLNASKEIIVKGEIDSVAEKSTAINEEQNKCTPKVSLFCLKSQTDNANSENPVVDEKLMSPVETPPQNISKTVIEQPKFSENFEIYTDCEENLKPVEKFPIYEEQKEPKTIEKFEIFEDAKEDFQFKIPKPVAPLTGGSSKEQDIENIGATADNRSNDIFEPNDTCSTQTFNMFIKLQSVSTPKQLKKNNHSTTVASALTNKPVEIYNDKNFFKSPPEEYDDSPPSQIRISPNVDQPLQPRQLSTILETSEPNTASTASGGGITTSSTTKSSDCYQTSSPESENELSATNHHQISSKISTKYNSQQLQTIPEIQQEPLIQSSKKKLPQLNEISRIQNKEETIPSLMASMKIFEEKTDTISKILLIPTNKTTTTTKPKIELSPIKATIPSKIPTAMSNSWKISDKSDFVDIMMKTPKLKTKQNSNKQDFLEFSDESLPRFQDFSFSKLKSINEQKNENQCALNMLSSSVKSNIPKTDELNFSIVPGFEDFGILPKNILKIDDSPQETSQKIPFFEDVMQKCNFPQIPKTADDDVLDLNMMNISTNSRKNQISTTKFGNNFINTKTIDDSIQHLNKSVNMQPFDRLTLPSVPTIASSAGRKSITKPRISIFERIKLDDNEEQQIFEDNIRTDAFVPNTTGIKNSTLLSKTFQQIDKKFSNTKDDAKNNLESIPIVFDKEQCIKDQSATFKTLKQIEVSEIMEKSHQEIKNESLINEEANQMSKKCSFIQEKSFHIIDQFNVNDENINGAMKPPKKSILSKFSEISRRQSRNISSEIKINDNQIDCRSSEKNVSHSKLNSISKTQEEIPNNQNNENEFEFVDCENSIYKNFNHEISQINHHEWKYNENSKRENYEIDKNAENDDKNFNKILQKTNENVFVQSPIDFNQTRQIIEDHFTEKCINPFQKELLDAFLNNIDFIDFLKDLPSCLLLNKIPCLKKRDIIKVQDKNFEVQKIIGQGAFGTIFCAKEKSSGRFYALKQEKPANLWEYYICLELKSRLKNQDFLSAFMDIEYSVIGNNAGILISDYSKYGSLISVCNKVKQASNKTIDESIIMILSSQMLSAIDHLHSCNIIHADVKADNFLLMSKLIYGNKKPVLQLIDFGCSIDMEQFPQEQKFNYISKIEDFKCIEMRENRPWNFQIDLYGLAGVFHVLLFGKHMEVEKKSVGWMHKTVIPRYYKKTLWQMIFNTLLNIPDCNSMPNLQYLKTALEEEIEENEKHVRDKISQFNTFIE